MAALPRAPRAAKCDVTLPIDRVETCMEAGNSPDIIFQHCRELVTEETPRAWLGITPTVVDAAAAAWEKELAAKVAPLTVKAAA